jgi:pSer/pThr/pTyr-binding forkhead associated (FHA) protein
MKVITIGKSTHNQIVIPDPYVSKEHLRITQTPQGYFLEDLQSTNGTYVNGKKVTSVYLQTNDIVKIGNTILPWQTYFIEKPVYQPPTTSKVIQKISIGRSPQNDIQFSDATVSSQHAFLEIFENGVLRITDNQSSNGTFVNGKKITTTFLQPNDTIQFGNYTTVVKNLLPKSPQPSTVAVPQEPKPKTKPWTAGILLAGSLLILLFFFYPNQKKPSEKENMQTSEQKKDNSKSNSFTEKEQSSEPKIKETNREKDRQNLSDLVEKSEKSVFLVSTYDNGIPQGFGSGFFVTDTGIGVSNHHVFANGNSWTIKLKNGETYKVTEIIREDPLLDYVIFRTNTQNVEGLPIATEVPRKGEDVFVIGNPQGLELSVTKGIISGIRNYDKRTGSIGEGDDYLQMDAPISSGNSGGPVFNMKGEVVGISTMVLNPTAGGVAQNLNLAVNIQKLNLPQQ